MHGPGKPVKYHPIGKKNGGFYTKKIKVKVKLDSNLVNRTQIADSDEKGITRGLPKWNQTRKKEPPCCSGTLSLTETGSLSCLKFLVKVNPAVDQKRSETPVVDNGTPAW
ncbi:hypothetical protein Tco_0246144 [Tanacetum coccineum]